MLFVQSFYFILYALNIIYSHLATLHESLEALTLPLMKQIGLATPSLPVWHFENFYKQPLL